MTRRRRYGEIGFAAVLVLAAVRLSRSLPGQMSTQADVRYPSSVSTPVIPPVPQSPARSSFSIRYGDVESPFRTTPALLMPGEELAFKVVSSDPGETFEARSSTGRLRQTGAGHWSWTAPAVPGIYPVVIEDKFRSSITLKALVMVPRWPSQSSVNGYPIGFYPSRPPRNNPIYLPPRGLVEVTEANQNVFLTPHFQLGQFVCKQGARYPKYLVIHTRLLLKLEMILEEMNRLGYPVKSFHVMSGYRTPKYNAALKNVPFSTHQFGYAADIFVDESPRDGLMDDLNGDGHVDRRDADVIMSVVARMDQSDRFHSYQGGLGGYPANRAHGPFVHVDVRGWDARWGLQPPAQQASMR